MENRKSFSELAEANVISGGAHMNGHESQMHQSKSTGERDLVDLAAEGHGKRTSLVSARDSAVLYCILKVDYFIN